MNLFKESFFTLQLFTWVFYIGGAVYALWGVATSIQGVGFDPVWDTIYSAWSLLYLIGGLYFIFNVQKLLPKHRVRVLQAITALFVLEIIHAVWSLYIVVVNPTALGPEFAAEIAADPQLYYSVLGGSTVGMALSFLVYLVIRHAINTISGVPPKKPALWMTIVGWLIVVCIVGGVVLYSFLP